MTAICCVVEIVTKYDHLNFADITQLGHLQKPVNRHNFQTETLAQLFGHHSMAEESFNVDAFNQRDNTGK